MNTARIVVLTIAVGAGGVAAYLACGSDSKPPPAEPVAQLQTVDVLVAKSDIGFGQTVAPDDMHHPDRQLGQNSVVGRTATLELKPEQTSTLAAARQAGALSLALRASPISTRSISGRMIRAPGAATSMWFVTASQTRPRYRSDQRT